MNAYGFQNIGGHAHYPDPLNMRVWSNDFTGSRPVGVYMSARVRDTWAGAGPGTLVVMRDHPLADRLMQADYDVVPITAVLNGRRWVGRVREFTCEGVPGREVLTCTLVSEYAYIHAMLGWPSTFAPLEAQFPPQDIQGGPLATVALHYIAANAARLGVPVYVKVPDRPDTSPWVRRWARMTPLDELLQSSLEEHGYRLQVDLWLPGEPDPGPVVNTKTLGLVNFRVLEGIENLLTFMDPGNILGLRRPQEHRMIAEPGLIVSVVPKRDRQFVRWSTAEGGGIQYIKTTGKHPEAHTIVGGGKSPDWVGSLLEVGIDTAIEGLLAAAGVAVGAVTGGLGGLLVAGVGGLLTNALDNVFLAFARVTDQEMKARMGPLAYPEKFTSTGAGAFTIDGQEAVFTALQEARGGRSMEITVLDGKPHRYGSDERLPNGRIRRGYVPGDIHTFEDRGTVIEDYVSAVELNVDGKGLTVTPLVGDSRITDDPMVKQLRQIKGLVTFQRAAAMTTN